MLTLAGSDSTYVGTWRDNKQSGQGTYTYANGNKYVGEFKDNKQSGQGTYIYTNG
ncbi:MAG: MORN motif-containing protein, partial [Marinovum sp.]|nr:MORN motif-containing protein [Marinovum sp.]